MISDDNRPELVPHAHSKFHDNTAILKDSHPQGWAAQQEEGVLQGAAQDEGGPQGAELEQYQAPGPWLGGVTQEESLGPA